MPDVHHDTVKDAAPPTEYLDAAPLTIRDADAAPRPVRRYDPTCPALDLGAGLVVSLSDAYRMAKALAGAVTLPKWLRGPGDVLACMMEANATGLPLHAVIRGSHMIDGKLSKSPELMLGIVQETGELEDFQVQVKTAEKCTIRLKRRGRREVVETFTIADAERAALTKKDNWRWYPQRMLYHRCLGFILRDNFPDILVGIYTPDELGQVTDDLGAPVGAPVADGQMKTDDPPPDFAGFDKVADLFQRAIAAESAGACRLQLATASETANMVTNLCSPEQYDDLRALYDEANQRLAALVAEERLEIGEQDERDDEEPDQPQPAEAEPADLVDDTWPGPDLVEDEATE